MKIFLSSNLRCTRCRRRTRCRRCTRCRRRTRCIVRLIAFLKARFGASFYRLITKLKMRAANI